MKVPEVLCMKGGNGETSYARNSKLQKLVITKGKPVVIESISDLYTNKLPPCLRVADLGCSSGPNTLVLISEIIEAIEETCHQLNHDTPEFQFLLNDLPNNDFNTFFKTLPAFYEQLKKDKGEKFGPCFINGVPGSFYGRLFPSKTLDFFHSTNSLNWLSQVPLMDTINKGNIYLAKTTPPSVLKAYLEQYQKDFSLFLSLRFKEITLGGRMVLTIIGRRSEEPFGKECGYLELISKSLNDLVLEGLIEEAKVDSFNLPYYIPSQKELEDIIFAEGSFSLDQLKIIDVNWDGTDDDDNGIIVDSYIRGQNFGNCARATLESMFTNHFGDGVIDILIGKYSKYVSDYISKGEGTFVMFVISLGGK